MNYDKKDIRSCFYHVGKTNEKSIFFISDAVPITEKYIDHEYKVNNIHVIVQRNEDLLEINRKFRRIIAMENRKPNYFRQHITDVKNYLIKELEAEENKDTN